MKTGYILVTRLYNKRSNGLSDVLVPLPISTIEVADTQSRTVDETAFSF